MKKIDFNVSNEHEKNVIGEIEYYTGNRFIYHSEAIMLEAFKNIWNYVGLNGVRNYKIFSSNEKPRHGLRYAMLESEAGEFLQDYTKQDYIFKYIHNDNNNLNTENLDDKFEKKLYEEYKQFSKDIGEKSKEEIFDSAYEITIKNEIINLLQNMSITQKEKEMLISHNYLLEEFYLNWTYTDITKSEDLQFDMTESIKGIIAFYNKQNELNNEFERDL